MSRVTATEQTDTGFVATVDDGTGRPYTVWISDYEMAAHGSAEAALDARMTEHVHGIYEDATRYGTD